MSVIRHNSQLFSLCASVSKVSDWFRTIIPIFVLIIMYLAHQVVQCL